MSLPRLDVLIYAHDGRGLGHAGRSIGIGMSLRRLYPDLKILFLSGCKFSRELIGPAKLDWLKLPSYETAVVDGKSRGTRGNSNFSDQQLGVLRAQTIKELVQLYKPRIILCDHTPQGKHKELIPALEATLHTDTKWVLGVRGVVGAVPQVKSGLSATLFQKHYHALFWYGDSTVLGKSHLRELKKQFATEPIECGYVSRLSELIHLRQEDNVPQPSFAGTISIPWLGERSQFLLEALARALNSIGPDHGRWRLFLDLHNCLNKAKIHHLFQNIPYCILEAPGDRYIDALLNSKTALIYGGYNSLMDVLAAQTPAVVLLREMRDNEQQVHLLQLCKGVENHLLVLHEQETDADILKACLLQQLQMKTGLAISINLNGAETAAQQLSSISTLFYHEHLRK